MNVHPARGSKFVNPAVILVEWVAFSLCALLVCFLMDLVLKNSADGDDRPFDRVKSCFEWKNIKVIAPAGIGWGLADVCEVMALGQLDPVIYGVLTQMRLLGTAVLATVVLKRRFTTLQWIILAVLTLLVISFSISGGGGGDASWIEWSFALMKQFLSVCCGVYGEKRMKSIDKPFVVQFFMIGAVAVPFISISLFLSAINPQKSFFTYGFLGGYDFGWDNRTVMLVIFYILHFLLPTLCCKKLSALNKNICNGLSLIVLYVVDSWMYIKTFFQLVQ